MKKTSGGAATIWKKFWYVIGISAWVFIVVVGIQFLLGFLLSRVASTEVLSLPIFNMLFSAASYILALLCLILVTPGMVKIFKKSDRFEVISRERIGLRGLPTWTDIGLAPIGYIASIAIAAGITAIFNLMPWFNANEAQELGYSYYMMGAERGIAFIALAVIAPIAEEIIFRGWLYGKLRISVPKWLAILVTSLLFGLIHMQWNVGITVFAMSVVNCLLREVTGTVYAGILVHMINNGVAFFLVYVAGMV